MAERDKPIEQDEFLQRTTREVRAVFSSMVDQVGHVDDQQLDKIRNRIEPGKMLRTRLAYALLPTDPDYLDSIIACCAATELLHTATLFHDDVIDGASLRRGQAPMWKVVGETGAILLGDLFFASALDLIIGRGHLAKAQSFVAKVREVCATEAAHELLLRGREVAIDTSLRIARGKTGPLFAFPAEACGGDDETKTQALREAGYLVGTAYQVADDLVDEEGDEAVIGKTLGTDRKRHKYTLAQASDDHKKMVLNQISDLSQQALAQVTPWPDLAEGLDSYLKLYLTAPLELHYQKAG